LPQTLKELVQSISDFDNWNQTKQMRFFGWYILTHENRERFQTTDVRQCFEKLNLPLPANISAALNKMASSSQPQVLKDNKGYRLEKKTFDEFNGRYKNEKTISSDFPLPDFKTLILELELARILEARWEEAQKTFNAGAYLSTIILLGSILEGLLLAKLKANPKQANTSTSAPKDNTGKILLFRNWTLDDMIRVCHEIGWLAEDVRDFSSALRGYRNLVHPNQQMTEGIFPSPNTCRISWEVVNAAIAHLPK
jgi:hypothetical protein